AGIHYWVLEKGPNSLSMETRDLIRQVNVLCFIRRQSEYDVPYSAPPIKAEELVRRISRKSIIMHSLPRHEEMPASIDGDSRSVYFKPQLRNVLLGRKILLRKILSYR